MGGWGGVETLEKKWTGRKLRVFRIPLVNCFSVFPIPVVNCFSCSLSKYSLLSGGRARELLLQSPTLSLLKPLVVQVFVYSVFMPAIWKREKTNSIGKL